MHRMGERYLPHERIWLEAVLELPWGSRSAALRDIAAMSGRTYQALESKIARFRDKGRSRITRPTQLIQDFNTLKACRLEEIRNDGLVPDGYRMLHAPANQN